MRTVSIVATILAAALVAGCSSASKPTPTGAPARPLETTPTLEALYGDRVTHASQVAYVDPPGEDWGSLAVMGVTLASGEPTGTEPFKLIATMIDANPGCREYQLSYVLANSSLVSYRWIPYEKRLTYLTGTAEGQVASMRDNGTAANVDTATIGAVALGTQKVPAFVQ